MAARGSSRQRAPVFSAGCRHYDRRIALVQPRIPDGNYLPNLGIMYLAGLLLRDGFEVAIFDENLDPDAIKALIAFGPSIIGITCVTSAINPAGRLAGRLKEQLPGVKIVVGGPHVTAVPMESLQVNPAFDFGFAGECEKTFPLFCRLLLDDPQNAQAFDHLPGLTLRIDGRVVAHRSAAYMTGAELDALPYPPWQLLPMERIFGQTTHGLFSRGKRIMPVMTSRGCPHYCTFCNRTMGFNLRCRGVENVMSEITWLCDTYNIDELYFEDDTFTQDPARAHRLLDAIIEARLGLHIKFANGLRADAVDGPMLEKMQAAGVYWVGFGIESGSSRTQRLMMKGLDLDLAAENVRLAKRMGFKVGSNCIIGYPGETREDLERSLDYFLDLPLDSFAVVPCIPFPGTTAWIECRRHGYFTARASDYDNYWFEIFKVNPLIETPQLSAADLAAAIRRAYVRFYVLNPRRSVLVGKALFKKALARAAGTRLLRSLRGQAAMAGPGKKGQHAGQNC